MKNNKKPKPGGKTKKKLTGAELLIEALHEQGVSTVFGYPGGQVVDIYDALYRSPYPIEHILTAHEQGASHAADGWARVTGDVGVVIATSGPGATNLVTGIATAMLDSVPLVAITGNVSTAMIGRDAFQEINITGITMAITKHNYFVSSIDDLLPSLREAFQVARSGRPGPVLVDIPKDVQTALGEYEPLPPLLPLPLPGVPEEDLRRAAALIEEAERPYIYIGGGTLSAGVQAEVLALAEKTDAYIGASLMGLGALPTDAPRFLGMEGMHGRLASTLANRACDLIIGVGVRFSDRATGNVNGYGKKAKIIQLDADLAEVNKNVAVDAGLVGDLKDSLTRLTRMIRKQERPDWTQQINGFLKQQAHNQCSVMASRRSPVPPEEIFGILNRLKDDGTVVATDVGQHQMWTAQFLRQRQPRRFITSGGLGTMGYGMGAAIGAHFATGERAVLVTGDGSFAMNLNELATAVRYRVPLTIILLNNTVLGMVRQWQTLFFGKRYSQTLPERVTNYVALAKAFGAKAAYADTPETLEAALKDALQADGPTLIEVPIDPDELVLPMMPPGGSLDDLIESVPLCET
ncbi:MAG: biosynthetic-type acetolactate synthase large subunit [Clostridia bacterium]|nr:biosynthetic-type acetolactate synthase large subunit [Clostridia bacterium]